MDYMLAVRFTWEAKNIVHLQADLASVIETMKQIKQIVEEFYEPGM